MHNCVCHYYMDHNTESFLSAIEDNTLRIEDVLINHENKLAELETHLVSIVKLLNEMKQEIGDIKTLACGNQDLTDYTVEYSQL